MISQTYMQQLKLEGNGALGFMLRECHFLRRFWKWEAVFVLYTFVNALSIGYIVPGMAAISGGPTDTAAVQRMVLYLLIGSLVWGFLATLFDEVSSTITMERWEGTIEYTFMAPVSRAAHMLGVCAFAILYGLGRTLVILLLVSFFFNLHLGQADLVSAFLVLATASLSFVGLGVCAAVLPLLSPEKGSQVSKILQALILMVSGIFYPIDVLPGWMQTIAWFSPATYALEGIRGALLDGAGISELAGSLGVLCLCGLLLVPLGLAVFGAGERYAKQAGLLKRNG